MQAQIRRQLCYPLTQCRATAPADIAAIGSGDDLNDQFSPGQQFQDHSAQSGHGVRIRNHTIVAALPVDPQSLRDEEPGCPQLLQRSDTAPGKTKVVSEPPRGMYRI
jgi:hypothetical protein